MLFDQQVNFEICPVSKIVNLQIFFFLLNPKVEWKVVLSPTHPVGYPSLTYKWYKL